MARYRGFWRICYGWCLLCCILPTVEAATKKVNLPSLSQQVENGSASLANDALTISTAIEGEYIPAATKNVPVRGILGGAEFGLNTIKAGTRGIIKGGVAGIVVGAALDQLLKGLGWVMEDGTFVKKGDANTPTPTTGTAATNGGNYYVWEGDHGSVLSSAEAGCFALLRETGVVQAWGDRAILTMDSIHETYAECHADSNRGDFLVGVTTRRFGSGCPPNSDYSQTRGACYGSAYIPLTDKDFIDMDTWINNQDSNFVKGILKQQCAGSLAPDRCYEGLRQRQLDMRGPSSVDAGSTTTKSTHANSDGTTSTTTTTTNNKYDITYGPSSFTYNKSSTSTTSTDGKPGDTTTTTEQPSDEADPDDSDDDTDDKTTPSPCSGAGCDGPKYEKLYEPTKDTKEKALDSYASRVKALPIVASVAGFFTVSASAGCPSWSTNVSFAVFASMFSYDLVFDFYCQPWFVSMAQYAKIVFSIVCAYLAFRQAILD
jgi:hypothetical protein